jgi:outer membrane protein assembly factor BamB
VSWLPAKFPAPLTPVWERSLSRPGVGGIAATAEIVVVSDRSLNDDADLFRCLEARTGEQRWQIRYPAPGELDYGNSPRATPLIDRGLVYLQGAFGHLTCADVATGEILWQRHLRRDFGAKDKLVWGTCSSPLIVDGKLIVNPGGPAASLAALDPQTGEVLWQSPGAPAAFNSFGLAMLGGRVQLVGHDKVSLGGWDPATGIRYWSVRPHDANDFNVPSPVFHDGRLIVSTENNGTRLFEFGDDGQIDPRPAAENHELQPDIHTPVVVGGRLFGVWSGLHCLDLRNGLKRIWVGDDSAFDEYAAIMASEERLLIASLRGELLLVDAAADEFRLLDRIHPWKDEDGVYAHPAIVGSRIHLRASGAIRCYDLAGDDRSQ